MASASAPSALLKFFPDGKIHIRQAAGHDCLSAPGNRKWELDDLRDLLASVRAMGGVLVPGIGGAHPTLTGKIELFDGSGRAECCRILNLPMPYVEVASRPSNPEVILIRNACNEIRSHMDDAQKGADMWTYKLETDCTQEEVSEIFHRSTGYVSKLVAPFKRGIPELVQMLRDGRICPTGCALVAAHPDEVQRQALPLVEGKKRDSIKGIMDRLAGRVNGRKQREKTWKETVCGVTLSAKVDGPESLLSRIKTVYGHFGQVLEQVKKNPQLIYALPELLKEKQNGTGR